MVIEIHKDSPTQEDAKELLGDLIDLLDLITEDDLRNGLKIDLVITNDRNSVWLQ